MRNLKKVLAMALALVMSLSLVTIANAADFSDDADISYKEAVDVMSAIGVINGYEDGSFQPDGILTREEAAKLICTMLLGSGADRLGTTSSSFTDVAATRWSAPFIEYCNSLGIIAGNGDGTFDPTGELTGHAFAKMLLVALGYDSAREGYTGAGWSIEVAKDAITAGIDVDGVAMSAEVTREVAAQMAFNTLQADLVEYATAGTTVTTPDGTVIVTGGSTASRVENSATRAGYNGERDGFQQFCEEYFDDLEKDSSNVTDSFGRPSIEWVYDGDSIGTYADEADELIVADDDNVSVNDILTDSDYMNYRSRDVSSDVDVIINGTDGTTASNVRRGDIVEAFEDEDGIVTTVVVRHYQIAVIDDVNEDLSSTEERNGASVELTLVDLSDGPVGNSTYYDAYDDEDQALTGYNSSYEEGTVLALALASDGVVLDSYVADSISGSISGYRASSLTMDGTRYYYVGGVTYNDGSLDFDEDYTVYLTAEGYVLGVEGDTSISLDDVYYVVGVYSGAGSYGGDNFYAQAVSLADGTVEEIELDVDSNAAGDLTGLTSGLTFTKTQAGLYTFDDGKAAVYDTAAAGDYDVDDEDELAEALDVDDERIVIGTNARYYLDSNTSFLAIDDSAADIEVVTATGGMRVDDPDATDAHVYVIADGRDAVCVVLVDFGATMASDDVVYIAKASYDRVGKDQYEGEIWFMETSESETVILDKTYNVGFWKVSDIDEDGVYTLSSESVPALPDGDVDSDAEGYDLNLVLDDEDDIYRDALTRDTNGADYDDVSLANAVVIDSRPDGDYAYTRDINSVSRLVDSLEQGSVTLNLYVIDGEITFIDVTDSADATPDDDDDDDAPAGDEITETAGGLTYTYTAENGVPSMLTVRNAVLNYLADEEGLDHTWDSANDSITATETGYRITVDGLTYNVTVTAAE